MRQCKRKLCNDKYLPLPIFDMRRDLHLRNFWGLFLAIFANFSDVKSKQVKIIGGQDAIHGQFPYQVSRFSA